MKISLKFSKIRLPEIDWQKYARASLSILALIAFAYSAYLIRQSQAVALDQKYLEQKQSQFNPQSLKISQDKLDALGKKQPVRSAGRNPFSR